MVFLCLVWRNDSSKFLDACDQFAKVSISPPFLIWQVMSVSEIFGTSKAKASYWN